MYFQAATLRTFALTNGIQAPRKNNFKTILLE